MSVVSAGPALRRVLRGRLRFFQTPKGLLLVVLAALLGLAGGHAGVGALLYAATVAGVAAAFDVAIVWMAAERVPFPGGALLSGLIVAAVVAPAAPWYVAPATAATAVLSKHLIRTRWSNVFNPAALGLVASYFLFQSEQSWWGALPDLHPAWTLLLCALGLCVASKVRKVPLVLAFTGAALSVFTVASFAGDAAAVAEIYRAPDINAILFFAMLMLTDPPTSPARYDHQIWFGLIVAAAACFAFLQLGVLWFLTGGLLVGNAWESARRVLRRRSFEASRARARAG